MYHMESEGGWQSTSLSSRFLLTGKDELFGAFVTALLVIKLSSCDHLPQNLARFSHHRPKASLLPSAFRYLDLGIFWLQPVFPVRLTGSETIHTMSPTMVVTLLLLELGSFVENSTCDSFGEVTHSLGFISFIADVSCVLVVLLLMMFSQAFPYSYLTHTNAGISAKYVC